MSRSRPPSRRQPPAGRQEVDAGIDRLYQLPLAEFVAARQALAREGPDAAAIRALQKPTLPAWAVNQLYWRERDTYEQLINHAADVRATHDAAARNRPADVRAASRAHEDAVERALKATLALLAGSGQPVTDATRQAIATTLRGLPADEPAGRLTRPLEPRGFSLLTAATAAGRVRQPPDASAPAAAAPPSRQTAQSAAARRALAAAERATREAEQRCRRDEFEVARAARDAEQRSRRVREAEEEVAAAEEALRDAQTTRDTAARAAAVAAEALETARARAARSAEQLDVARRNEGDARESLGNASGR